MRNVLSRFRRPYIAGMAEQLMLLNSTGDGSTLSLDFTTGVLDPRLTFSRDGGGTYIGNDGRVYGMDFATSSSLAIGTGSKSVTLTATAGVDRRYLIGQTVWISNGANNMRGPVTAYDASTQVLTIDATGTSGSGSFTSWTVGNASARFDYDPTTQAPRGLLIEGQTSTLNAWGEDYTNAYWTKVGSSVGATSVAGPDNVSTATRRIVESATTSQHGIRRGIATTAGQTYTVSVFVKPGSYDSFGFELYWSASYNAKAEVTSISGNTQTVTSASGVNATLTRTVLAASGWYRYALTFTHPSAVGAATPDFNVFVNQTTAYVGNGTNYMDVYGFMLEAGSGASSYIPTGASQGTRNADKMSMTDISTMQWNQTAGTFALHMDVAAETNTSSFPAFMGMYTATPVRVVRFLLNNSSGTNPRIGNDTWTATPTQILSILVTRSTAPTAFKFAVSLSNTGQTANQVVNAGSVTTTSGTGTLQTPTRLLWHQDPSALDTEYFPIHIRSMKYWPTALPNAQLQSLTT